eukprot:15470699-Alexandrium_andersonii.AAC.1
MARAALGKFLPLKSWAGHDPSFAAGGEAATVEAHAEVRRRGGEQGQSLRTEPGGWRSPRS